MKGRYESSVALRNHWCLVIECACHRKDTQLVSLSHSGNCQVCTIDSSLMKQVDKYLKCQG